MSISALNGPERVRAAQAVAAMRSASQSGSASNAGTRQPDSVSLSETARSLAGASKAVADAPEIRADRVAALKAAIASGTYQVDSRQLARDLIRNGAL